MHVGLGFLFNQSLLENPAHMQQFYPLILELHHMTDLNEVLRRVLSFCLQAVDAQQRHARGGPRPFQRVVALLWRDAPLSVCAW